MRRKIYETAGRILLYGCAAVTAGLLLFLIGYILFRGIGGISWRFLSTAESVIGGTVGILPAIKNTLFVIVVSLTAALPLGVGAAVYLTEYALDLLMAAKYFERIGDHAANIAGWVLFSVTGDKGAPQEAD